MKGSSPDCYTARALEMTAMLACFSDRRANSSAVRWVVSPILLRGPLRKNGFGDGFRGTPSELIGTEIAERTVWMVGVVIAKPMSSLDANIGDRREPIGI